MTEPCPMTHNAARCQKGELLSLIGRLQGLVSDLRASVAKQTIRSGLLRAELDLTEFRLRAQVERAELFKRERDEWMARAIGVEKRVGPEVDTEA